MWVLLRRLSHHNNHGFEQFYEKSTRNSAEESRDKTILASYVLTSFRLGFLMAKAITQKSPNGRRRLAWYELRFKRK